MKKEDFIINLKPEDKIDLKEIFGNDNPLRIEIGSGHGEFIKEISERFPKCNFIGFELKTKRINTILKKLDIQTNSNVRLANVYVNNELFKYFEGIEAERIYINHPDPWPKRRHHKKRLIQTEFIDTLRRILQIGGIVQIATDHRGYAEWIIKKFKIASEFEPIFDNGYSLVPYEGHIITHFETMKRKEGFVPIFMHFRRTR